VARITVIPKTEFDRVQDAALNRYAKLALLADMNRANTLASVKRAGSGHLGSSFSSLDIVTLLYFEVMNKALLGTKDPNRDIFFSSKGHDVPGLYSVFHSIGILDQDQLMKLRRIDGTCGHPDVGTAGVEANTGSLGMGVSKGKGMAFAKRLGGYAGRVFVMTGDGELQEGQIYETLQTAVQQGITNLEVIVDHNKVQSDMLVSAITDLGNLEAKFRAFGWHVATCDGHDFRALEAVLGEFATIHDRPKILIADTIKGRGVSFMEHPADLEAQNGIYRWHSGAPNDEAFEKGHAEIMERINRALESSALAPLSFEVVEPEARATSGVSREYVAEAFGEALVEVGSSRLDVVVLDADLAADCRIRRFQNAYPDRFIENGIAEQDMVSMAGGLALQGLLPVVNTFASFLSARANEQIYNNVCERTRIIYVNHYSGLIPAGPGQSHQSIRDISLLGSLPGFEIIQPCNALETKMAVDYVVNRSQSNCVLRLIIGPSPRIVDLPPDYSLTPGVGAVVGDGTEAAIFAYGPVMLNEALVARDELLHRGVSTKVVNMPWLNQADPVWLESVLDNCSVVFVLEDHAPIGGLGDTLLNVMQANGMLGPRRFRKLGVRGLPAWGTPSEVLKFHELDGTSVAERLVNELTVTER